MLVVLSSNVRRQRVKRSVLHEPGERVMGGRVHLVSRVASNSPQSVSAEGGSRRLITTVYNDKRKGLKEQRHTQSCALPS